MPLILKTPQEGEGPDEPHLGLLTDESGLMTAIPPGAVIFQILDAKRQDGITPLILVKVSNRGWVFRCACKRPGCTRVLKMQAKWEGWHQQSRQVAPDDSGTH